MRAVTSSGFPLDDAWIHLQFARNLAGGEFFSFNSGEPTAGLTTPLWPVLLSLLYVVSIDPVIGTKLLGVALAAMTALCACQLAYHASGLRVAGVSAGIAVAANSRLTWGAMSGMENPLYAVLATLTCLAYLHFRESGRGSAWGWLAGAAGAARPELFIMFPIFLAASAISHRRQDAYRPLAFATLGFVAGACAFVAINIATDGRPLPNTFYAKTGTAGIWSGVLEGNAARALAAATVDAFGAWNVVFQWLSGQSLLLMTAVLPGTLVLFGVTPQRTAAGAGVVVATLVLLPLAKGAFTPEPPILSMNGRYLAHLVVLHLIVASVGFAWLLQIVKPVARWGVVAVLAVALARILTTNVREADVYAAQVKSINDMQVRAADWVRQNTPPAAVIATNDIGAIGYFGGRRVIDTQGLVTPVIIPYRRAGNIIPFLEKVRPYVVIVYPEWHPEVATRKDLFSEVHRFTVRPRVVAPADAFVVYDTPWR